MNELIENSIAGRKSSIYNCYEISDAKQKEKIEKLFEKIADYGKNYDDYLKFEEDFAKSSLNQEYINLFTELSQVCKTKLEDTVEEEPTQERDLKEEIEEEINEELEYQLKSATLPFRRKARERTMSKLRSTPVIGDLIQLKQTKDLVNKYTKKKDK